MYSPEEMEVLRLAAHAEADEEAADRAAYSAAQEAREVDRNKRYGKLERQINAYRTLEQEIPATLAAEVKRLDQADLDHQKKISAAYERLDRWSWLRANPSGSRARGAYNIALEIKHQEDLAKNTPEAAIQAEEAGAWSEAARIWQWLYSQEAAKWVDHECE